MNSERSPGRRLTRTRLESGSGKGGIGTVKMTNCFIALFFGFLCQTPIEPEISVVHSNPPEKTGNIFVAF